MSDKINKIELNRRRIALAYLDFCQRHYGGDWANVTINKAMVRVEVSQVSIELCLKEIVEKQLRAEYGIADGQRQIATSYGAMLNRDASKLTPLGAQVMEEMMLDAVTDKLQNPDSILLQVVA